jgi:hypothetical protein
MGTCSRHPDRETPYQCIKHQIFMCEACMTCRDPDIYCKHRSACAIHFIEKERRRAAAQTTPVSDAEAVR